MNNINPVNEPDFEKERLEAIRAFLESPIPQCIYDPETLAFLDVNQAATALYGYTKEEFLTMTLRDIRPADEISVLEHVIRYEVLENKVHQAMAIHKKRNGDHFFVSVKGNAINYQGIPARLVHIVDLSGHHLSAAAIASSEMRFKLLVQDGLDLVAIFDPQGVYKFASPTAKTILGIAPELLIGRNVFDFVHPEDRETAKLQFKLLEQQERMVMPPFRYRHFNGETRWMETTITNRIDNPVIKGIISNSRDVTDRIQKDIELKKILDRYNTVSKATSDAIWDFELATQTITWNKGLRGLFGHQSDQSSMDWWKAHIHPEDRESILQHFSQSTAKKLSKSKLEYRFRCADGSYRTVLDRSFIQYDQAGQALRITGSMQDITEMRKYIAEIERQNDKLREISFLQSHKLRAPLAAFMGLVSLIDPDSKDPESLYEIVPMLIQTAREVDQVIIEITKKASGYPSKSAG